MPYDIPNQILQSPTSLFFVERGINANRWCTRHILSSVNCVEMMIVKLIIVLIAIIDLNNDLLYSLFVFVWNTILLSIYYDFIKYVILFQLYSSMNIYCIKNSYESDTRPMPNANALTVLLAVEYANFTSTEGKNPQLRQRVSWYDTKLHLVRFLSWSFFGRTCRVPSIRQIELFYHLLQIIIISYLKPYSHGKIIYIR